MLSRWARIALAARRSYSAKAQAEPIVSATTSTGGRDTIGRRLLSLIHPKRSAVIVLNKWMEQGKTARKYELNRVVRELRKYKRYKHALEICEWMVLQQDIKLLPGDYAVHLDLVAKVRGLASAEKFFVDLPEQMRGQLTCTSLLHTYARNKSSAKAEALMEKMSECGFLKSPLPYNHMISLYIAMGQLEKIPIMIEELKKNIYISPDVYTYNLWLTACSNCNDVEGAEKVFLELQERKITPDWVTYSLLTSIYTKAALLEKAKDALKEMEKRVSRKERVAYCSLISLHTNICNKDEVYRIWKNMKSSFRKMNDDEYTCMLTFLVKLEDLEEAQKVYSEWESVSGSLDPRVPNVLLGAYVKKEMMDKAKNFHECVVRKGIIPTYSTWETLAWGYLSTKKMDKVLECLKKAFSSLKKWEPNKELIHEVFKNLERVGDIEGAEQFLVMLRDAGHVTTQIYNSLLRTYAKAGKMPLIIAERMKKDEVQLDEETHRLIKLTSKLCVGEVSSILS